MLGLHVACLAALMLAAVSGEAGGNAVFDNLWLGIPALLAGITAIGGLLVAAAAILWRRERSVLVIIPLVWGLVVAWFVVGELMFPH